MKSRTILPACVLVFIAVCQPVIRAQQETDAATPEPAWNSPSSNSTVSINPPASCVVSFLADYVNWLQQKPQGKTNIVHVALASNQPNRLVTYSEGTLTLNPGAFPPGPGQVAALTGTLRQYFSDRRFNTLGGLSLGQYPFAPDKTDQLGLDTDVTGEIRLTLKSYNNTVINLTSVTCGAGVLSGLTNTSPLQSLYVISLSKDSVSNVQPK
jgi:hypothetical protein